MNDPYVILGVAKTASDDEVKRAYRELARKYHPDNYVDNPLADLAQEKMKEINEAYDAIERERAGGASASGYTSGAAYQTQGSPYSQQTGSTTGIFKDIREAIATGDLNRAELLLGSINDRGAEWQYLMGQLCFRRGWMQEASRYFHLAATMDPGNPDYRQAVAYMNNASQTTYNTSRPVQSSVDTDMCCNAFTNLMIADCCCECMGGDLIRCI